MTTYAFAVQYADGSIEDFTGNDGDSADDIRKHVETFLTEAISSSWDRITIHAEEG